MRLVRARRGDLVWMWFDTGMGARQLYGIVEKSGRDTYVVRWASGIVNRIRHGQATVMRVDQDHENYEGEWETAVDDCQLSGSTVSPRGRS